MIDLNGRTALVTGAAQGIGRAIAQQLAALGATVALVDIKDEVNQAAEAITTQGYKAKAWVGNILKRDFLDAIIGDHGGVDILVNNAGIIRDGFIGKLTEEDWDAVMAVNLKGPFLTCQAVLPAMRERQGGKIINIISRAWLGNIGQSNYSASKGGLVSLTRTLALELARFNVLVNGVAPGLIDTPMTRGLPDDVQQRLINQQPTRRMGSVDDIAAAVAFLASDRSNFISGQILHVDGGKSCGLLGL